MEKIRCGHSPIAAAHHSVVTRVSGVHANTASSSTRTHRPGSSRVSRCHMRTVAMSCSTTASVATTPHRNGARLPTIQKFSICAGMTCPAMGSNR